MARTDDIADAVRRAREGDGGAWRWLHDEYRGTVHAVALSHGPASVADDWARRLANRIRPSPATTSIAVGEASRAAQNSSERMPPSMRPIVWSPNT